MKRRIKGKHRYLKCVLETKIKPIDKGKFLYDKDGTRSNKSILLNH